MSAARERAIAWRHADHALVCGRIEAWAHGTVVRAPDAPSYYHYNLVRVERDDPGLSAEQLAGVADDLLDGLGHRRVELEDEAAGARVWDGFRRLGWVAERLVFMARGLPAPPAVPPAGAELRVEGFEATRPLRLAWQSESVWNDPPEFALLEEAVAGRRGTRAVIGRLAGEPAGFAAFASRERTAEVELVFCRPERRGRGLGGALVSHALAEAAAAGAREALIEADDHGDARRLYERLGFRTVWRRCSFTKVLR